MSILLESQMKEPPFQSAGQPDSLVSHDTQQAGEQDYPFTRFRPSSLTTIEGQGLDSPPHLEAFS